jgi:multidrug efflux system outer membrane protein
MSADPKSILSALLALTLTGCAVGPDYRRPEVALPASLVAAAPAAGDTVGDGAAATNAAPATTTAAPVPEFWHEFGDAELTRLIARALAVNYDLRIADARLAEARALRGATRLDLAPTVTAGAEYAKTRSDLATSIASGRPRTDERYRAGFDASWEPDLFGRVRRGVEARGAEVGAAGADRRAASVAVAAEVAATYSELRGLQLRRAVAQRNLANQAETLRITRSRFDAGRGTQLDVSRAEAQLAITRATVPTLDAEIAGARRRLAVLAAATPAELDAFDLPAAPLPPLPALVATGTPDAWLRRRPDVAAAERRLAAATAGIGVATGDLFPRVVFAGSVGVAGASFSSLDDSGGGTWSLVPGLRWAAFDLGRVRARIVASEARAAAALADYERTVLTALEETQNALTALRSSVATRDALATAATESATAARLARLRNDEGAADFLDVLDAERTQLTSEERLAVAETDARVRLVAVYKALGAGWDATESAPARRGR